MESSDVQNESFRNVVHRFLSASSDYNNVEFETDRISNERAPDFWVSWIIAGVLTILATVQYGQRVYRLRNHFGKEWTGILRLRAMMSAYIDHNDDPFFVIAKFSAQSFWFLGGIQINYQVAFAVMLGVFALESSLDTLRVLLGYWEASSLAEYRHTHDSIKYKGPEMTLLAPSSVYEDLTRPLLIVFMVFFTQAVLISFVVADIFNNPTHTCLDGTRDCPVAGTLGSWALYVLGAFMALVFLLGPKTAYGQSEQNPAYWMKLLILSKKKGARLTWHDPVKDLNRLYKLGDGDYRIWIRFLLNFLINGVGFHLLVHALPMQVAAQSSLTGVVIRAVGMMYLVDLDDTAGYKMTVMEGELVEEDKPASTHPNTPETVESATPGNNPKQDAATALLAERIIQDAKIQLDRLAKGEPVSSRYMHKKDARNEFSEMSNSTMENSLYDRKQHFSNEVVTQIDDGMLTMPPPDPSPGRR